MAEYLIQDTTLTAIADAIRAKTGGTEAILPENMAATILDIDNASGYEPCICERSDAAVWINYKATATAETLSVSVTVNADYEALGARATYNPQGVSWALGRIMTIGMSYTVKDTPTPVTETVSDGTRTFTASVAVTGSTSMNKRTLLRLSAYYINPYFYIERKDGITIMRAYENVGSLENFMRTVCIPDVLDLSAIKGPYTVYQYKYETIAARKIIFPAGVTINNNAFEYTNYASEYVFAGDVVSIGSGAFFGNADKCTHSIVFDFTKCTTVPTALSSNIMYNTKTRSEIRVPAALYDEWIAATNWSALADYIVAV